jgi:hypothetical protein
MAAQSLYYPAHVPPPTGRRRFCGHEFLGLEPGLLHGGLFALFWRRAKTPRAACSGRFSPLEESFPQGWANGFFGLSLDLPQQYPIPRPVRSNPPLRLGPFLPQTCLKYEPDVPEVHLRRTQVLAQTYLGFNSDVPGFCRSCGEVFIEQGRGLTSACRKACRKLGNSLFQG